MRSEGSDVWGDSWVESHPVEVEAEEQNGWGGCWKEALNPERRSFYLLSPHSDSKHGQHWCVGAGVLPSSPSSALCFPPREPYSSKASAWKASHSLQCSPNLEKSNENVKRWPSGTGKNLPLASSSSSALWRSVCTHAVCGCVLLLGVTHTSESFFFLLFWDLTSSTKPQNRLFFSGRDVRV